MESALRAGGGEPGLILIETLARDAAGPRRADRHLARMAASAERFGWGFDRDAALVLLHRDGPPARLRLTLDAQGRFDLTEGPLPPPAPLWRVGIADARLRSDDPWLRVKSSRRTTYDAARAGLPAGVDELILLNERGEVCDGTITNVFFDRGQGLRTPPVTSGLLPGVLRAELIDAGAREEVLLPADLPQVRLWVGNALRGLIPAEPVRA